MRNPTLWAVDMGDGTWAVSCRACRLYYRGPKPKPTCCSTPTCASRSCRWVSRPDDRVEE